MSETILRIAEYRGEHAYTVEAGFIVFTDEQAITLAIDDEPSCCESWGYFLTEDEPGKFIGATLLGVSITDTNRSNRTFPKEWSDTPNSFDLDEGDVMFVDIETDRGVLQFVAYNAHNGYYGHRARVASEQISKEVTL